MTTNTPSILVVDDEVDTCRNLSDILTDLGYHVDIAHEGLTETAAGSGGHVGYVMSNVIPLGL